MKKRINSLTVYKAIFLVVFTLLAATYIFPILFLFVSSFKGNVELLNNMWALPKKLSPVNYVAVFSEYSMGAMFVNSMIITFGGVVVSVAMVVAAAYALARFAFKGRSVVFGFALVIMFIPTITSLPAVYKLMADIKLMGTIPGILLLYASPFGMNFFVMYAIFRNISGSYTEAAKIDGASEMTILLRLMVPMAASGIAVICLMSGIAFWNDYMTPYIYLREIKTLATGLHDLSLNAQNRGKYVELFAAAIITILPIMVVYALLQKQIIGNIMAGGLKG